ncbi:phosphonate ABC transporter, permease protein PhnE [Halobacteriovorax sp. JY17]|uniref:phosphonate ABC transporter, permease protein PhnE n=1 Tax=Halobacteriovorax sp. JY17 TaxID=2014617 RepID=UPI000C58E1E9|nr:phosphonate ABC transporter, permease protein PhnE [Halobacteriovorax sp. JY17]PIK15904.1 MAG: phosphonate ABC transporter, permease protein PhnE [Halobacteriovorax sp. JY17]
MTTLIQDAIPGENKGAGLKKAKKVTRAYAIDLFLWSYMVLASWKIIYEKIFIGARYATFTWSQPLLAVGIGAVVALGLFFTRVSIGRAVSGLYESRPERTVLSEPYTILGYVLLVITFISGIFISQVSITEFLSSSGLHGARRIFTALFNPNFAIIEGALFAAIETIYMAFIATILALPMAFVIAFFAARNLMNGSKLTMVIYSLVRFFLNVSRSIEPLVWAIIFSVWVGIGPFAGMLALWLHSVSSLSKLYSEQIENISNGPIEAMTATGAHPIQVIWFGVVPQIVLPYLSFTIYRWDINVRMATVIGLVGGGGIGTMLMQYQGLAKWNEVGLLVIIIAAIVWIMDYLSSKIREAIK